MRDRSIKQPNAPKGIDKRTWTRYATSEDMELAGRALQDLSENFLRIGLVPAPEPHFEGHKIRVIESENPKWYGEFFWRFDPQGRIIKRCRIIRGLERVYKAGRVRGNGYEMRLLEHLRKWWSV